MDTQILKDVYKIPQSAVHSELPFTTASDPASNATVTAAMTAAYSGVLITLTGAGNSQTLATPTDTTAGRTLYTVINNDTSTNSIDVIANSVTFTITPGEAKTFIWDGSAWGPIDLGLTSIPVPVTQGGTGANMLTDHGLLLGSGSGAVTPLAEASDGQIPIGSTGNDPTLATITPGDGIDVTNAAGSITVSTDLKANGGIVIESTELALDLGASSITGTLAVANGGTGVTTLNDILTLIGKATASGLASLNASSLVVQDPANATATPTASKIPIADASGKLNGWVTGTTSTTFQIGNLTIATYSTDLADEAEVAISTGKTGRGWAMAGDNEEYIEFRFTADGVVTVISNTANAVGADTDGNLCVYDAGSGIAVKNRLGSAKTIRYSIMYS